MSFIIVKHIKIGIVKFIISIGVKMDIAISLLIFNNFSKKISSLKKIKKYVFIENKVFNLLNIIFNNMLILDTVFDLSSNNKILKVIIMLESFFNSIVQRKLTDGYKNFNQHPIKRLN